jgi:hypothetical protein
MGGKLLYRDGCGRNVSVELSASVQQRVLHHADVVRCGTLQVRFVESADPIN